MCNAVRGGHTRPVLHDAIAMLRHLRLRTKTKRFGLFFDRESAPAGPILVKSNGSQTAPAARWCAPKVNAIFFTCSEVVPVFMLSSKNKNAAKQHCNDFKRFA